MARRRGRSAFCRARRSGKSATSISRGSCGSAQRSISDGALPPRTPGHTEDTDSVSNLSVWREVLALTAARGLASHVLAERDVGAKLDQIIRGGLVDEVRARSIFALRHQPRRLAALVDDVDLRAVVDHQLHHGG